MPLLANILVSHHKLAPSSRVYQCLNLLGAIGIGTNVFTQHAWPAVALQVAWGPIAIYALLKHK